MTGAASTLLLAAVTFGSPVNSTAPAPAGGWKDTAIEMRSPKPSEVARFCGFVTNFLAPAGVKTVVLRTEYDYRFTSHPECADVNALSREEVRTIRAACLSKGMRLVPKMNALGHQGAPGKPLALLRAHPDMAEVADTNRIGRAYQLTICPRHPDTAKLVRDLALEMAEAFGADTMHVGMDEVFDVGKCDRCRGVPTDVLFADWVNGLARALKAKGVTPMMWSDRLLDSATTPYGVWEASDNGTHAALGKIDRDVVLCDWHYENMTNYPSAALFAKAGYGFYACPWRYADNAEKFLSQVVRDEAGHCRGLLFTTWYPAAKVMDAFEGRYLPAKGTYPKGVEAETLAALARTFQWLFPKAPGDRTWFDGTELPLEGQGWSSRCRGWRRKAIPQAATYDRIPEKFLKDLTPDVAALQTHTAGETFRFVTDSDELRIAWRPRHAMMEMWHMPSTGVSGVDVYQWSDEHGCWRFVRPPWPCPPKKEGAAYTWKIKKGVPVLVNLPLYNGIDAIRFGVKRGTTIREAPPRRSGVVKPVVFYGTSTTQGGCVSRPGLCWPSVAGRKADVPTVNLGFSGSGKMEPVMVDVLAEIDASCYVLDTVGNMDVKLLDARFEKFVRALQAKKPLTPIVLLAYPWDGPDRDVWVRAFYARLKGEDAEKWSRLHLLDNSSVVTPDNENTVEGAHLGDVGALRMGEAMAEKLVQVLKGGHSKKAVGAWNVGESHE